MNRLIGLYFVVCFSLVFLHSVIRVVDTKSREYYDEMLLLLSVNGDKNDEQDRYLNGYADLQLKKAKSVVSYKQVLKILSLLLHNLHNIFIT